MNTKVAIVHEWLSSYGGTERVLTEVLRLYPQADLFALIYNKHNFLQTPLADRKIRTTFLQQIPGVEKLYRALLPLMPLAIESLNVRDYDLVISLSHAVAHGVKTTNNQKHLSYISTPMRYAWHMQDDYLRLHKLNRPIVNFVARATLSLLRRWDVAASRRSDSLLANSKWTASHIRKAWERESRVIYPPVNIERFSPAAERDDYYIHVSRLVPYKMTAEIVNAFNELGLPLVIIGNGPEMPRLQKLAKRNIKLMGYQTDEVVADMMNRAKGFVYMATEDFGIAMVEAQAAGCPVIAYGKGGAQEIVRDGETGLLFQEQSSRSLMEAILESQKINSKAAQENAARFSAERFRMEFSNAVNQLFSG